MIRVLCVDDDPGVADTTAELLRRRGFEVRVCYDGLSALDVVDEFRPTCA